MSHTEGPWTIAPYNWNIIHEGKLVCTAMDVILPREEQEANARLIAASPDLLALAYATLEAIHAANEPWWLMELETQARAAIAKTEEEM